MKIPANYSKIIKNLENKSRSTSLGALLPENQKREYQYLQINQIKQIKKPLHFNRLGKNKQLRHNFGKM